MIINHNNNKATMSASREVIQVELMAATHATGGGNRLNPTMHQLLALKASRSVMENAPVLL